ncbi:hypothetical protein CDL12_19912 [Handroanthus impetiginosus]|uniref:Zinc-ribbon 15 domain-containing protein n=1 Tax=Handroanthus impetiginosus TaxID=429701 RepID=A0A2G9GQI1_9LAMI|nr:hypothetical protein CDL12_19912 [Handroanthus impetiginosus]
MMFFFIVGLNQRVTQVLKSRAGKCTRCGSSADLVQYEKVLRFYFVPIMRWPGKEPLMKCRDCSNFFPHSFSPVATTACQSCASNVDAAFKFCPFCGSSI